MRKITLYSDSVYRKAANGLLLAAMTGTFLYGVLRKRLPH
jgi:hypothetical protein